MALQIFPGTQLKLAILPRTKAGMSRAGLRHHLEQIHGPLCMAHGDVSDHFQSYAHHYGVGEADPVFAASPLPDRDALTVMQFAEIGDLIASKSSKSYAEFVGPDEDNFRELDGSVGMMVREWAVLPQVDGANRKLFVFRALSAPDEERAVAWAEKVAGVLEGASDHGLSGYTVNMVMQVAEGETPGWQFDELMFAEGADISGLAAPLRSAAADHFAGVAQFSMMTEPKIFK